MFSVLFVIQACFCFGLINHSSVGIALAITTDPTGAQLPNFIGYTSISALLGAIADFIIDVIAIPFAVVMIIYSGFLFITARGNEEKIRKARSNIAWTLLGVTIILASRLLITYITEILNPGTGSTLTTMITNIKNTLNQFIVLFFAIATIYFIWGVVQFLRATGSGDEKGITDGKRHMLWGVIGMAVMGGAIPIVNFIISILQGQ